jgi:hypothetical protein
MTAADPTVPEPTHACVRCGRPVALSMGMCDRCNPLGLADPAASQVHGTVFLAIGVGIAALAIAARLAVSGVGPFAATVAAVAPTATGMTVTLTVTNQGSRTGTSTCRIHSGISLTSDLSAYVLSPPVEPGTTVTFTRETTALGTGSGAGLIADCATP